MLRKRVSAVALLLILSPAIPVMSRQSAGTEPTPYELKIYDLRDLQALLAPPADSPDKSPLKELMGEMSNAMQLTVGIISDGIYTIGASPDTHAELVKMLESVRALYSEHYTLDVTVYSVEAEHAPSPGDPAKPEQLLTRTSVVVSRRTPFDMQNTTRHLFVREFQPILAQGAVGYAPTIGSAESGAKLTALVGAGTEVTKGTTVQISGALLNVTPGRPVGIEASGSSPGWKLELPREETRAVRGELQLEYGKLTVLCVTAGFSEGQSLVVAAAVRKLSN